MKEKNNLFILIGPTAIGKTALSIELAEKFNGEIISADSMQIYKYMDIGSAKISRDEMKNIPHHLIDIVLPDEEFTVANFKENASRLIKDINNRGKLPIIAGGTGLYVNSLVYDLNFTQVSPNESIRDRLEILANEYGNEYLHQELQKIDKISADRISENDRKRLIRAIEIYEVTNKPMSEHNKDFRVPVTDFNLVMVGLNMDRSELYNRINKRVDIMIDEGLIKEVEKLVSIWGLTDADVPGIEGRRISIETASKVWNACGLRIGAVITDNAEFNNRSIAEYTANLCANVIGQYIFGALAHESKENILGWCQNLRDYYKDQIVKVYNGLKEQEPGLIVSSPDASIYSVIDVRNVVKPKFDSIEFVLYCAGQGSVEMDGVETTLLVAPMKGFYDVKNDEENPGKTQFRISFVESPENMAKIPELFVKLLRQYEAQR